VRYAKWRAADISKAIREGRQPTLPVSTGGEPVETTPTLTTAAIESPSASASAPVLPIRPPPTVVTDDPDDDHIHVGHEQAEPEPYSTSILPLASTAFGEGETPFEIPPGSAPVLIDASDPDAGHDLLTGTSETPLPPILPHDSPTVGMEQGRRRSTSIGAMSLTHSPIIRAQHSASPTHLVPPDPPYLTESLYPSAPPLPPPPPVQYVQVPSAPPLETSPPTELTPGLITKAQKHCRFAISALDYEDAEQARKELRAALAILGG
jgi:vacuolar protein sorting-associated protein VTA1